MAEGREGTKGGEEESILLMQMRPWTMMMVLASAKCAKRTCEDGRKGKKGKEKAFLLAATIAVLAAIRVDSELPNLYMGPRNGVQNIVNLGSGMARHKCKATAGTNFTKPSISLVLSLMEF